MNHSIITGVRYIQVVKRSGVKGPFNLYTPLLVSSYVVTVDKLEQMLGSYAPHKDGEPYTKNFDPEESPSGMLARTGTYIVKSRVIDDDGVVYTGGSNTFRMPLYCTHFKHRL